MSRVKAVVDNSIMVDVHDILPGKDILYIRGNETDPIISSVQICGHLYRLHYKPRSQDDIHESMWMNYNDGGNIFIHDLKKERDLFVEG